MNTNLKILFSLIIINFYSIFSFAQETARITIEPLTESDRLYSAASGGLNHRALYLDGVITEESPKELERILILNKVESGSIYLNSPGGNLIAGLELGKIIRKFGLHTDVSVKDKFSINKAKGHCFSSCIFAYAGGVFRFLNPQSTIGLHRFSRAQPSDLDLDIGQIISATIIEYLTVMGIDTKLFSEMVKASKDDINVLGKDEFEKMRLINNGKLNPKWTIEISDKGFYIQGEQITTISNGKVVLSCNEKTLYLTTYFLVGDNYNMLVDSAHEQNIRIDKEFIKLPVPLTAISKSGEYLTVSFKLDKLIASKIYNATDIGYAIRPHNPEVFSGFTVEVGDFSSKLRTFLNNCNN